MANGTQQVTAIEGDTLCTIAINAGFADCRPLRALPANVVFLTRALEPGDVVAVPPRVPAVRPRGVDARHRFRRNARRVGIRLVHGSRALPVASDLTVRRLNISNYVTNQAGPDATDPLVPANHFRFDADADIDEDTFKVEVIETRPPGGNLEVLLEALRPQYDAGGNLTGHTDFPGDVNTAGSQRNLRSLRAAAGVVRAPRFRTGYLRLVTDDVDKAAVGGQTLLVSDMVAAGDRQVEILDHDVRATYFVHDCPVAAPQVRCHVTTRAAVSRGRTVRLAVRVLRGVPSGAVEVVPGGPNDDGVVRLADIRRRIQVFCRRCWAQSDVRFRITRLETVDLPSNMLSVADATGNRAFGRNPAGAAAGQVGFTVRVQRFGAAPDSVHVVAPINIPARSTPTATAGLIRDAINALPGLAARVSPNAPEVGDPRGSVDILITDSSGGRITLTGMTPLASQDRDQQVMVASVRLTVPFRNAFANYHVGHPEQRNLVKALDTGDRVIDIQVVTAVPGTRGFTVPQQEDLPANRRPVSGVRNSIIMPVISSDSTSNNPFSLPHEIGHILTDNGLHSLTNTELMRSGTSGTSTAVTDSKRIWARTPGADNWEVFVARRNGTLTSGNTRLNAVARVRSTSRDLMS